MEWSVSETQPTSFVSPSHGGSIDTDDDLRSVLERFPASEARALSPEPDEKLAGPHSRGLVSLSLDMGMVRKHKGIEQYQSASSLQHARSSAEWLSPFTGVSNPSAGVANPWDNFLRDKFGGAAGLPEQHRLNNAGAQEGALKQSQFANIHLGAASAWQHSGEMPPAVTHSCTLEPPRSTSPFPVGYQDAAQLEGGASPLQATKSGGTAPLATVPREDSENTERLFQPILPCADEKKLHRVISDLRFALRESQSAYAGSAREVEDLRAKICETQTGFAHCQARVTQLESALELTGARSQEAVLDSLRGRQLAQALSKATQLGEAAAQAAVSEQKLKQALEDSLRHNQLISDAAREEREKLSLEAAESRLLCQARARQNQALQAELEEQHDAANAANRAATGEGLAAQSASLAHSEQMALLRGKLEAANTSAVQAEAGRQEALSTAEAAKEAQVDAEVRLKEAVSHRQWLETRLADAEGQDAHSINARYDSELRRLREALLAEKHQLEAQLGVEHQQRVRLEGELQEWRRQHEAERGPEGGVGNGEAQLRAAHAECEARVREAAEAAHKHVAAAESRWVSRVETLEAELAAAQQQLVAASPQKSDWDVALGFGEDEDSVLMDAEGDDVAQESAMGSRVLAATADGAGGPSEVQRRLLEAAKEEIEHLREANEQLLKRIAELQQESAGVLQAQASQLEEQLQSAKARELDDCRRGAEDALSRCNATWASKVAILEQQHAESVAEVERLRGRLEEQELATGELSTTLEALRAEVADARLDGEVQATAAAMEVHSTAAADTERRLRAVREECSASHAVDLKEVRAELDAQTEQAQLLKSEVAALEARSSRAAEELAAAHRARQLAEAAAADALAEHRAAAEAARTESQESWDAELSAAVRAAQQDRDTRHAAELGAHRTEWEAAAKGAQNALEAAHKQALAAAEHCAREGLQAELGEAEAAAGAQLQAALALAAEEHSAAQSVAGQEVDAALRAAAGREQALSARLEVAQAEHQAAVGKARETAAAAEREWRSAQDEQAQASSRVAEQGARWRVEAEVARAALQKAEQQHAELCEVSERSNVEHSAAITVLRKSFDEDFRTSVGTLEREFAQEKADLEARMAALLDGSQREVEAQREALGSAKVEVGRAEQAAAAAEQARALEKERHGGALAELRASCERDIGAAARATEAAQAAAEAQAAAAEQEHVLAVSTLRKSFEHEVGGMQRAAAEADARAAEETEARCAEEAGALQRAALEHQAALGALRDSFARELSAAEDAAREAEVQRKEEVRALRESFARELSAAEAAAREAEARRSEEAGALERAQCDHGAVLGTLRESFSQELEAAHGKVEAAEARYERVAEAMQRAEEEHDAALGAMSASLVAEVEEAQQSVAQAGRARAELVGQLRASEEKHVAAVAALRRSFEHEVAEMQRQAELARVRHGEMASSLQESLEERDAALVAARAGARRDAAEAERRVEAAEAQRAAAGELLRRSQEESDVAVAQVRTSLGVEVQAARAAAAEAEARLGEAVAALSRSQEDHGAALSALRESYEADERVAAAHQVEVAECVSVLEAEVANLRSQASAQGQSMMSMEAACASWRAEAAASVDDAEAARQRAHAQHEEAAALRRVGAENEAAHEAAVARLRRACEERVAEAQAVAAGVADQHAGEWHRCREAHDAALAALRASFEEDQQALRQSLEERAREETHALRTQVQAIRDRASELASQPAAARATHHDDSSVDASCARRGGEAHTLVAAVKTGAIPSRLPRAPGVGPANAAALADAASDGGIAQGETLGGDALPAPSTSTSAAAAATAILQPGEGAGAEAGKGGAVRRSLQSSFEAVTSSGWPLPTHHGSLSQDAFSSEQGGRIGDGGPSVAPGEREGVRRDEDGGAKAMAPSGTPPIILGGTPSAMQKGEMMGSSGTEASFSGSSRTVPRTGAGGASTPRQIVQPVLDEYEENLLGQCLQWPDLMAEEEDDMCRTSFSDTDLLLCGEAVAQTQQSRLASQSASSASSSSGGRISARSPRRHVASQPAVAAHSSSSDAPAPLADAVCHNQYTPNSHEAKAAGGRPRPKPLANATNTAPRAPTRGGGYPLEEVMALRAKRPALQPQAAVQPVESVPLDFQSSPSTRDATQSGRHGVNIYEAGEVPCRSGRVQGVMRGTPEWEALAAAVAESSVAREPEQGGTELGRRGIVLRGGAAGPGRQSMRQSLSARFQSSGSSDQPLRAAGERGDHNAYQMPFKGCSPGSGQHHGCSPGAPSTNRRSGTEEMELEPGLHSIRRSLEKNFEAAASSGSSLGSQDEGTRRSGSLQRGLSAPDVMEALRASQNVRQAALLQEALARQQAKVAHRQTEDVMQNTKASRSYVSPMSRSSDYSSSVVRMNNRYRA
ncbi:hypothetical protein CYMTET_54156 [Cymbomonas tetramitiformis]|uniref:Uncharacterized protein n=1 Tax=Cymbomonas tetramitiformis TaxID=36881 RepID=A0AAE0ER08_9CHLO|nr:hypothetical protein CYMTET_54156 [Cymbomonas tetramitiformis]